MPRFAANLSMMFTELPFLDRFEAAARAGFPAVEFLFPYEHEPAAIAERLRRHGLQLVLFNAPPGNWAAGERGLAGLPGRTEEFRASIETAIRYARVLGCPTLHVMAGALPQGASRELALLIYARSLDWAIGACHAAGVKVVIEPLNARDNPTYLLRTNDQAATIVEAFGAERIGIQFDLYHCQITEGDLTSRAERLMPLIGHMQLADVPGRHEPGTGEIGWDFVLRRIDELGYAGWIGCEYRPLAGTEAGLGWLQRFKGERRA